MAFGRHLQLYRLSLRYPRTVLASCLVFTLLAAWGARQLRTSEIFEDMLPEGTESVRALEQLKESFGELGYLVLVIEDQDSKNARSFAETFASRIESLDTVHYVQFQQPRDFFIKRQWLYLTTDDLLRMEQRIDRALDLETKGVSPIFADLMDFAEADQRLDLSFQDITAKYQERYGAYLKPADASQGQEFLTLWVKARDPLGSLEAKQAFVDSIREIEQTLKGQAGWQSVQVGYTGSYQTTIEGVAYVQREMTLVSIGVMLTLLLILWMYFGRLAAAWYIGCPLVMAMVWTGGLTYLIFGSLNLLTAFAAAILAGLGSDYGIYLLSRFDQEKSRGLSFRDACDKSFGITGRATRLAMLTTAVAFGALLFSGFSVLRQFGVTGALGLLMSYLAMMVVMPCLLSFGEAKHPARNAISWFRWHWIERLFTPRWPVATLSIVAGLILLAGTVLPTQSQLQFESGGVNNLDIPGNKLYDRVSNATGRTLNPTILITKGIQNEEATVRKLSAQLDQAGSETLIYEDVLGLSTFVPERQLEKKQILRRILDKYQRVDMPETQARSDFLASLQDSLAAEPIRQDKLPPSIAVAFHSPHQEDTYAVLLYPSIARNTAAAMKKYQQGIMQLRGDLGLSFTATDGSFLAADAIRIAERQAPRGIFLLLLLFAAFLVLIVRPWQDAWMILLHLCGALALTAGGMWLIGVRFTVINIAAVPIVIGTGIDCFIHMSQRFHESGSLQATVRDEVPPIMMASLTSIVGFAGLLATSNSGLRSVGWVAVIGIAIVTLLCTFVYTRYLLMRSLKQSSLKAVVTKPTAAYES